MPKWILLEIYGTLSGNEAMQMATNVAHGYVETVKSSETRLIAQVARRMHLNNDTFNHGIDSVEFCARTRYVSLSSMTI
jgi:hypothetical protein